MDTSIKKVRQQLQYIEDFLIKIGNGDYDSRLPIVDEKDEQLHAVQIGINMLVEELKETTISKVFLDSIYNGINDILIVLNEKGEIQRTNPVVENVLLYNAPELLHQPIEKLIQANDVVTVGTYIKNAYEQNKIQETGLNLIAKDNSIIPVSCSFSPLYTQRLEQTGVLLVAKDIRALLNAKTQFQDKNDELNLFVYKASHDLKSPVASMLSLTTFLEESKDITEIKMYTRMISECTLRLNNIITDLLVLGRITYGELEYSKIEIKPEIDTVLKNIELEDGFKDIDFSIIIEKGTKSIVTEKGLFQTLLQNLIDNAVKYRQIGHKPSFINIHISKQAKGILISIEDNGIGIAASQQANIFKMFFRATTTSRGSGLGLYIVKTSVLKLGGSISFESTYGKGTTFKVYIPSQ